MERYFDTALNNKGEPVIGLTVTVTDSNGNLATLYADNGATQTDNPFFTDKNGAFFFYAANGRYTLSLTADGVAPTSIKDVILNDPADKYYGDNQLAAGLAADLASSTAGKGMDMVGDGIRASNLASKATGKGADLVANAAKQYDPRAYGAKNDGSDISAALAAAIAAAPDYGTVVIQDGIYGLGAQVIINKPINLKINGTLKAIGPGTLGMPLLLATANDVTIFGGVVDGNNTLWAGIQAANSAEVLDTFRIQRVRLKNLNPGSLSSSAFAIDVASVENAQVRRNRVENCGGFGIYTQFNKGSSVVGNKLEDIGYAGINVSAGIDNTIEGNIVRRVGYFGMKGGYGGSYAVTGDVAPTMTAFSIAKSAATTLSWFEGCEFLITVNAAAAMFGKVKTITDNGTYYTITPASALDQAPVAGQTIELIDTNTKWLNNTIEYTGDNGFDINVTSGVQLTGNTVRFAGLYTGLGNNVALGAGIWIGADPQNSNTGYRVRNVNVKNNLIEYTYGSGIQVFGVDRGVDVLGNGVFHYNQSNNADYGAIEVNRLTYGYCTDVDIDNNRCKDGNGYGVCLNYCLFGKVNNNRISSPNGILLSSIVGALKVQANNVAATGVNGWGLKIDSDGSNHSTGILADGNTLYASDPTGDAINITDTGADEITVTETNWLQPGSSGMKIRNASPSLRLYQKQDNNLPGQKGILNSTGEGRSQHFTIDSAPGTTSAIASIQADNGTCGAIIVRGTAWLTGAGSLETFEVCAYGNTITNALSYTSKGSPNGTTFLAAANFSITSFSGGFQLNLVNNKTGDIRLNAEVLMLSRM